MRMQTITLNLIPKGDKPIIYASQFDNDRVIRFDLMEGEADYIYSGTETFEVAIRKPDDTLVTLEATKDSEEITVDDVPVTVYFVKCALSDNACACFGEAICELKITDGEALIGTINFVLNVERSPELNGITSSDGVHNLTAQIEAITSQVVGENYYDKQEIDNKFDDLDIPTKTSELENDSGFITAEDIPAIPTKTSQLTNDSGFITSEDVPTKTSQLTNDSGFVTIDDSITVNDKTWSSEKINEELINILPTGTASGSIANFDTELNLPLEIEADISDDVNGVTNLNIIKRGINLWDEVTELGTIDATTGENTPSNTAYRTKNFIPVKPNMQIYVVKPLVNLGFRFYGKNKNYLSSLVVYVNYNITIPNDCYYVRFHNTSTPTYNNDISINYPNTEHDYHAYNNSSDINNINLGGTYYNGGTLTIDKDGHRTLTADGQTVTLPDGEPINALVGVNNVYCDTGDITVQYKDTVQHYIDTRVQASRSASLMRVSIPEELEGGEDNER